MRDIDPKAGKDGVPGGREFLASADELAARHRGRLGAALGLAVDGVYGASTGLFAGCWMGLAGYPVPAMAAAFAGATASIALKIKANLLDRLLPAVVDLPGGRELARGLLDRLEDGPVAMRNGAVWIVFDGPAASPRLLSERAYARLLRTTPTMIEVDARGDDIYVTRLTHGRPDSSLSGRPAEEVYDRTGTLRSTSWYVSGRPSGEAEAMRAHALYEGPPTYAEEAFAPRI